MPLEQNLNTNTHPDPLVSHGGPAGSAAVKGRGGLPDPLGQLNCFNHGPMRTLTKEPGRNHRLLFCCRGSQQGWEWSAGAVTAPITTAGLLFICFGGCFIPGDSKGSQDDILQCNFQLGMAVNSAAQGDTHTLAYSIAGINLHSLILFTFL